MTTLNRPLRGELWDVDWSPGRGSEQAGIRPALIIQNDQGNRSPSYTNTIIAAVSSKGLEGAQIHVKLEPSPDTGLTQVSFVHCEQLLTISKERLLRLRGKIADSDLYRVEDALRRSLDL